MRVGGGDPQNISKQVAHVFLVWRLHRHLNVLNNGPLQNPTLRSLPRLCSPTTSLERWWRSRPWVLSPGVQLPSLALPAVTQQTGLAPLTAGSRCSIPSHPLRIRRGEEGKEGTFMELLLYARHPHHRFRLPKHSGPPASLMLPLPGMFFHSFAIGQAPNNLRGVSSLESPPTATSHSPPFSHKPFLVPS